MPAVSATLTWATPVKVEILGAHLEAYINAFPTISALRLCHRFGKGQRVALSRLPRELVDAIEAQLVATERQKIMEAWESDFKCFKQTCEPEDHLDDEQLEDCRSRSLVIQSETDDGEERSDEDRLIDHLWTEFFEEWSPIHDRRADGWRNRVGIATERHRGFFTDRGRFIYKHFGLEIWTSHLRLNRYPDEEGWVDVGDMPPETTIAYIKLPGSKEYVRESVITEKEYEDNHFFVESGYGMGVAMPQPLPRSSFRKFKRMMRILELKPCEFESSCHHYGRLRVDLAKQKRKYLPNRSWPRLTLLIKTTVRSDEEH